MKDHGAAVHEQLIRWILDLLDRPDRPWSQAQWSFLDSLLEGQEGTKTLAELAVTCVRIRASGLKTEEMGELTAIASAIETFWGNPCAETYENLSVAARSLDTGA